jgi:hypothetical protein
MQPGSGLMQQTFSQSSIHDNMGTRPKTTSSNFTQPSQYAEPNLPLGPEVRQPYPNANQIPQRPSNYPQVTYQNEQGVQGEMGIVDPQSNIQGHQHLGPTDFPGQGYILGRNVPDQRHLADSYQQGQGEFNIQGQGQSESRSIQGNNNLQSNQQYQQMQQRQIADQGRMQVCNRNYSLFGLCQ